MAVARHPVTLSVADVLAVRASIDQGGARLSEPRLNPRRIDDELGARLRRIRAFGNRRDQGGYRAAFALPLRQPAVEDGCSNVAEIIEGKERARRHRSHVTVDDDVRSRRDADTLEQVLQ